MDTSSERGTALIILAFGLVVVVAGPVLLWALAKFLPPILLGFARAICIAIAGATTAADPVVQPVMVVLAGALIGGAGIAVLRNVVTHAKSELFGTLVSVMSIWTGAIVDIGKDAYGGTGLEKVMFSLIAGALVIAGGSLCAQKRWPLRAAGIAVAAMPPLLFVGLIIASNRSGNTMAELVKHGSLAIFLLALLVITSGVVAAFGMAQKEA